MNELTHMFFPFLLLLARVGSFFMVLPIFGWRAMPMRVRAGITLLMAFFLAVLRPPSAPIPVELGLVAGALMMIQEVVLGLGLGLMINLLFRAVEQGGSFAAQQMGFSFSHQVNPNSGAQSKSISIFFEMAFTLFFLSLDGHHLLIGIIVRSYEVFPMAGVPHIGKLTNAVIEAGSTMLIFSIRMCAPLLAAFLMLSLVLGALARALPEMNILMISFPIRITVGLLMAAAMTPYLHALTYDLADCMMQMFA
jgi:flagellar biosynthetic protein FliR